MSAESGFSPQLPYGRRRTLTGRVKFFDDARGFGFIQRDDGLGDLFMHRSAFSSKDDRLATLASGQRVEFAVQEGRKGLEAASVRTLGEEEER